MDQALINRSGEYLLADVYRPKVGTLEVAERNLWHDQNPLLLRFHAPNVQGLARV